MLNKSYEIKNCINCKHIFEHEEDQALNFYCCKQPIGRAIIKHYKKTKQNYFESLANSDELEEAMELFEIWVGRNKIQESGSCNQWKRNKS